MRLSESSKAVLIGNKDLITYCESVGISMEKLEICNVEKMGDTHVFVLSKNHGYGAETLLEHDIETQPDIILIMEYTGDKKFKFETTSNTKRVLSL